MELCLCPIKGTRTSSTLNYNKHEYTKYDEFNTKYKHGYLFDYEYTKYYVNSIDHYNHDYHNNNNGDTK